MSYVILGRAIKNEYLALGTIFGTGLLSYVATSGGKKEDKQVGSSSGKSTVEKAVPINAGSSEEEQLMNSIKNYIKEAEEGKH